MLKHIKTLTAAMFCIAMALCVSCKKDNAEPSSGGGDTPTPTTHAYVDLGLPSGLLWATCNVGAENPEDYGDYFAWGETTTKSDYDWDTYKWCIGDYNQLTKYCTYSDYGYNGFVDNKTVLELSDDAARANWGGDWRMPTTTEWQELYDNTTSTWTTQNDVYGRLFTSTVSGYTDVSLFLPAAGYRYMASFDNAGSVGVYWSGSLISSNPSSAYYLSFTSGSESPQNDDGDPRSFGWSVRPVCSSQK